MVAAPGAGLGIHDISRHFANQRESTDNHGFPDYPVLRQCLRRVSFVSE
jgi:hypothetical protein